MTSDDRLTLTESEICIMNEDFQESCECEISAPETEIHETGQERTKRRLPSQLSQMGSVFSVQMRLFFKSKIVYVFLILALLIPVIAYYDILGRLYGKNDTIAGLLMALPIMMAIIAPMLSGRILSSEFRNKTAFMMFPLPVSRSAFYFGKFLASLVLSLSIFSLAYGLAILSGMDSGISAFPSDFIGSYIMAVAGVFAVSATAYGLGTMFRRGSVPVTVVITLGIPFLYAAIMVLYSTQIPSAIQDYLKLLPQFDGYQALLTMDAAFTFVGQPLDSYLMSDLSSYLYIGVAFAWGVLFLALGLLKIIKKEL